LIQSGGDESGRVDGTDKKSTSNKFSKDACLREDCDGEFPTEDVLPKAVGEILEQDIQTAVQLWLTGQL
jgi:hypothetical protein